jgi:hypothetical protein
MLVNKQAVYGPVANEVRRCPTPAAPFPNVKNIDLVLLGLQRMPELLARHD